MANIITVTDNRTNVTGRPLAVGDTIITSNIADGRPVMVVAIGTAFGIFDIENATVLYSGPTIFDCLNYYEITDIASISYIIPGENVDVNLVGPKDAGSNISIPLN